MQKLKKSLKKLANFKVKAKPAQAAKKAPAAKKKTQSLVKKAPKPAPKKQLAAKKAAPKPAPKGKVAVKADAKKKQLGAGPKAAPPAKVAKPQGKKTPEAPAKGAKKTSEADAAPMSLGKAIKGKKSAEAQRTDAAATAAAAAAEEEVILTDADGRRYCRVKDCDQAAVVDGGYCRYHYLLFWKNIQNRKKILSEGKLERYIEELTARYPDKYLELLRKDLRSEKDFMAAIQELEIDESGVDNEFEDEAQSYLEEVRGISGSEPATEREEDF